jgi:hypothetical protein
VDIFYHLTQFGCQQVSTQSVIWLQPNHTLRCYFIQGLVAISQKISLAL